MDKSKTRLFLAISALVVLLIFVVALISTFWPRYEERFFEFGILGKNKTAENYFPNDNPILKEGDKVDWYIYAHNHLGISKNVSIRVNILNSRLDVLNNLENELDSTSQLAEFPFSFSIDETIIVPFSWTILEIVNTDNSSNIKQLIVNDHIVNVDLPVSYDSYFSLIFELWGYDLNSGEYYYEKDIVDGFSSISLNIGFEVSPIII